MGLNALVRQAYSWFRDVGRSDLKRVYEALDSGKKETSSNADRRCQKYPERKETDKKF